MIAFDYGGTEVSSTGTQLRLREPVKPSFTIMTKGLANQENNHFGISYTHCEESRKRIYARFNIGFHTWVDTTSNSKEPEA